MDTSRLQGTRYELLGRIASGGMAEVFEGRALGPAGFSKRVAVKRLLAHLCDNETFVEMFLDEARIASELRHPNVVEILDLGQVGSGYFIVMEFVDGVDLRTLLGTRGGEPLPVGMAVFIVAEVLAGLAYAHERRGADGASLGIVHRDVSPANILVSTAGDVKLADFGIAKATFKTTRTLAGLLKGKIAYMSPEQARGLPVDARSDLFSAAVVLHELLAGRPLFEGASDFETLERIRTLDVQRAGRARPDVPAELDALLVAALSRDPTRRPSSAREMRDRLLPWADGSGLGALVAPRPKEQAVATVAATTPSGTLVFGETTVIPRPRRARRLMAVTAAAGVVVAAGAVALVVSRDEAVPPPVSAPRAAPPLRAAATAPLVGPTASREVAVPRAPAVQVQPVLARVAREPVTVRRLARVARAAAVQVRGVAVHFGTVTVQAVPHWATISIDGHKWPGPETTPASGVRLPVGTYRFRLRYPPEELEILETVRVEADKEVKVIGRFKKKTEGPIR